MTRVHSFRTLLAVVVSVTAGFAVSSAFAASSDVRKPVILDSQNGISDGQSGTVLQTAPLSKQPIVGAQSIAAPAELAPNSSTPYIVAPYIQLPGGGGAMPPPQPRPAPRPQ